MQQGNPSLDRFSIHRKARSYPTNKICGWLASDLIKYTAPAYLLYNLLITPAINTQKINVSQRMILNDIQIKELAQKGMIQPFESHLIRKTNELKVVSYGLSSFGYDIRLSPNDFRIFRHIPGTVVDPKNFNPENLESAKLHSDENGNFFVLPAHSYGLGIALERLEVPEDITIICMGKSTYARCGIIANVTPAEAAWRGVLTLEFSNSSSADCKIYANEGIVQLLFLEGEPCAVSYDDRKGKYQDQPSEVVLAKV